MLARIWQNFKGEKFSLAGLCLLAVWMLVAGFAPWLSPCDPIAPALDMRYASPTPAHPLGTDQFGRDLLSRLLWGARISLAIGLLVTMLSVSFGTLVGATAGYAGGKCDTLLMRLVDLMLAFPLMYLVVTCVLLFGADLRVLVMVMAATSWMDVARIVRADVLSLKARDYIKAAQVLGFRRGRILWRHLLPNALSSIVAVSVLRVADVIVLESGLSFLGLGVQPPTASWGAMIRDGRDVLASAWWITAFPGLAIISVTISLHLFAQGLRRSIS
jgi:peptide/nickel transport system permease protein